MAPNNINGTGSVARRTSFFAPGKVVSRGSGEGEQKETVHVTSRVFSTDPAAEARLVLEMREKMSSLGSSVEGLGDATLLRFLRYQRGDVSKACRVLGEHLEWRREFKPTGRVRAADITAALDSGSSTLISKPGEMPWVFSKAQFHDVRKIDCATSTRYAVYVLDKALAGCSEGVEEFGVVLDMADTGYRNLDPAAAIAIGEIVQSHYPGTLHKVFFAHVPTIFWGVWAVVKPFLPTAIRQQIQFVADKDLQSVLAAAIPADMLLEEYGGRAKWVPYQEDEEEEKDAEKR